MLIIGILCAVGTLLVGYRIFRVVSQIRMLLETAREERGFRMRKPAIGKFELKRINQEFWGISLLKVPATLTILETVLLAAAIRRLTDLPVMLIMAAAGQILPILAAYLLQIWRSYRFGRFNLERFDSGHSVDKELAIAMIFAAGLVPPLAVFLYMWLTRAG